MFRLWTLDSGLSGLQIAVEYASQIWPGPGSSSSSSSTSSTSSSSSKPMAKPKAKRKAKPKAQPKQPAAPAPVPVPRVPVAGVGGSSVYDPSTIHIGPFMIVKRSDTSVGGLVGFSSGLSGPVIVTVLWFWHLKATSPQSQSLRQKASMSAVHCTPMRHKMSWVVGAGNTAAQNPCN